MRLIVPLKNREEIALLKSMGVSGLLLETDRFTRASTVSFTLAQCEELIALIHQEKMEAYIAFNTLIHETDLSELNKWLISLGKAGADALVAFDLTVAIVAQTLGFHKKVIYQPGTFNTHSRISFSLQSLDLKGITLSRELSLDEIKTISLANPELPLSLQGHGFIELFVSRRKLITNHYRHNPKSTRSSGPFWLQEEQRPDEKYPIMEDQFGTQIFRPKKLASFSVFSQLDPWIKDWFISRLFLNDVEFYAAITAYVLHEYDQFLDIYASEYDEGTMYQKIGVKKLVNQ
ncbi:MAG: U32 family peptidase [Candidatus Izemoplasmatales bacterium]|mgnify:CR=1 FL=1|jgi:putative protease|nr:U32 family peptidase [Candidatus Izemoplasmatales bacterium]MDD4987278.1 U32 family peptidase [Candidatus Izemoplasmatales bacterium]MDD5601503.1 U32 family peptidase [Candidatus Izemoplasmatales bacterium]